MKYKMRVQRSSGATVLVVLLNVDVRARIYRLPVKSSFIDCTTRKGAVQKYSSCHRSSTSFLSMSLASSSSPMCS